MIDKPLEYEKMFAVERELWWYRSLHERVLAQIQHHFSSKNITLLDVGCGTGGLLSFLSEKGYSHIKGFDGSPDAVAFCKKRGLNVLQHHLNHVEEFVPVQPFDVIVCNDVLCYLTDDEIVRVLRCFRRWLKPNGIFISNNNAFKAFYGTHDIAIGSKRRFVLSEIKHFGQQAHFQTICYTYWSLFLSPLILAIRQWQALKLRMGWEKPETIASDVALPSSFVNQLLYRLVRLEHQWLPHTPFGSSVFTVMC